MMDSIFGKRKKQIKDTPRKLPKPSKESAHSSVPSKRFNDMIDYYTHELKTRLDEMESLKSQNEIVMKTALKQGSRNDERIVELRNLREENRILNEKVKELEQKIKSK